MFKVAVKRKAISIPDEKKLASNLLNLMFTDPQIFYNR